MRTNEATTDDKFWTELARAGEAGDMKRFNELLDSIGKIQISTVNDFDSGFWTPLMHAVEDGDLKRFDELIADGADVNVGNFETETYPITLAAEYGRDEMFFRLVELGASMDVDQYCCPCCDMWYGFNPADLFVLAMEAGSVKIARYLSFMGVRPWSSTRSLRNCGDTVREVAKASGNGDFLRRVIMTKELAQGYITRWRVEETIRFIKQSYRLEHMRLLDFQRLRNMAALVVAVAYFAAAWLGKKVKLDALARHVAKVSRKMFEVPHSRQNILQKPSEARKNAQGPPRAR